MHDAQQRKASKIFEFQHSKIARIRTFTLLCKERYFRGRVSNFNQSEARKHGILAFNWLHYVKFMRYVKFIFLE